MSGLSAVVFTTRACLIPCVANAGYSSVVDIFNVTVGTWSTAALSQARSALAATSLPNAGVAIFAGGWSKSCDLCLGCYRMDMGVRGMRVWVD